MFYPPYRLHCEIWLILYKCKTSKSVNHILMTPVSRSCSLNCDPRRYRLRQELVRSLEGESSTLSCKLRECFVGWVSVVYSISALYNLADVRVGCHALALYLVRSWSFERPTTVARNDAAQTQAPPSPISPRRTLTNSPFLRRRSSILIDMDVESKALPGRQSLEFDPHGVTQETIKEESDLAARKAGLGSLIKSAKHDVQVPEFNMDAFSDSFR